MSPILPTAQSRFDQAGDQQIKGLTRRKRIIMSVHEIPFTSILSPSLRSVPALDQYYSLSSVRHNVRALRPQSIAYQFLDRSGVIYLFLLTFT